MQAAFAHFLGACDAMIASLSPGHIGTRGLVVFRLNARSPFAMSIALLGAACRAFWLWNAGEGPHSDENPSDLTIRIIQIENKD